MRLLALPLFPPHPPSPLSALIRLLPSNNNNKSISFHSISSVSWSLRNLFRRRPFFLSGRQLTSYLCPITSSRGPRSLPQAVRKRQSEKELDDRIIIADDGAVAREAPAIPEQEMDRPASLQAILIEIHIQLCAPAKRLTISSHTNELCTLD